MDENKKVAIVTGANGGIGYEVTKGLLKSGFHVVMACRSIESANKSKEQLLADLPSAKLDVMEIDLSDFDSVKGFAQKFKSKFQRLDILVNNAGILFSKPATNKANIEMQFATNHLGHYLLTSLLIDLIPDSKSSRGGIIK